MGVRHFDQRMRRILTFSKAYRFYLDNQSGGSISQADAEIQSWKYGSDGALTYQDPVHSVSWTTPIADNTRAASPNIVNTGNWLGANLTFTFNSAGAGIIAIYLQVSHDAINYPTTGWKFIHLFSGLSGTAQTVNIEL